VSPVENMVAMIAAARQFEAQMKVMQTAEADEKAAMELLQLAASKKTKQDQENSVAAPTDNKENAKIKKNLVTHDICFPSPFLNFIYLGLISETFRIFFSYFFIIPNDIFPFRIHISPSIHILFWHLFRTYPDLMNYL
jgi:hypothetical protein